MRALKALDSIAWARGFSVALAMGCFCVVGCNSPRYYSQKYAPVAGMAPPAAIPVAIQPELQLESHTCGYHALAAAYRAFGLDPDQARLRFRLGVDAVAIPLRADSKGTLHPDLLRVITQDGFNAGLVDLESAEPVVQVQQHLAKGLPALVLISRRETGGLHWIVFTGVSDGKVHVADSLRPGENYTENLQPFLKERGVSALLLRARSPGEAQLTVAQAHGLGAAVCRLGSGNAECGIFLPGTFCLRAALVSLLRRFRKRSAA